MPDERSQRIGMYVGLRKMSKADIKLARLCYIPCINVMRKNVTNFHQNPLGRFFLEAW